MQRSGGRGKDKGKKRWILALCGLFTGAVNGLFGGGGGMIVVPALTKIAGYSVKEAHATAILVVLPVTLISAFVYFYHADYDLSVVVPCAVGMTAGGVLGAFALKKLSSPVVSVIFALVMLAAGIRMMI